MAKKARPATSNRKPPKAELDAIRARATKKRGGKPPTERSVLGTYRNNQARKAEATRTAKVGPRPSARAMERANPNARFKRGTTTPVPASPRPKLPKAPLQGAGAGPAAPRPIRTPRPSLNPTPGGPPSGFTRSPRVPATPAVTAMAPRTPLNPTPGGPPSGYTRSRRRS